MALTKEAAAAAIKRDSDAAFELGFIKAAQEVGVTEENYPAFRKAAMDLQAAEKSAAK